MVNDVDKHAEGGDERGVFEVGQLDVHSTKFNSPANS